MVLVRIGQAGANLNKSTNAKTRAGAKGEQTLSKHLTRWAASKPWTILLVQSFSTDGKGDIDFLLASGNRVVTVDAKNWGTGRYAVLDGKIGRTKKGKKPRKPLPHGAPNTKNQICRLQTLLAKGGLESDFQIARPIICLSETFPGSVSVIYDKAWTQAPYALCPLSDLPQVLDNTFQNSTHTPSPELKRLGLLLDQHTIKQ